MGEIDERIKVKSRWQRPGAPNVARVMAIGEGWVMYRFKGAHPGLLYWKDFVKKYEPAKERA